jgi:hypothetical protein
MISVAQLLTDIAGGFCPVSGKALPKSSSAQSSAAIRLLYSLAIEFVGDGEAVEHVSYQLESSIVEHESAQYCLLCFE